MKTPQQKNDRPVKQHWFSKFSALIAFMNEGLLRPRKPRYTSPKQKLNV